MAVSKFIPIWKKVRENGDRDRDGEVAERESESERETFPTR